MHNLMCYLCDKIRAAFHSSVVLAVLNQNRDIDAIKKCMFMIFQKLDCVSKSEKEQYLKFFEKDWMQEQLKNHDWNTKKIFNCLNSQKINDHELQSLVKDYETDYEFVRFDMERCQYQKLTQDYYERTMHMQKKEFSLTSDLELMFGPQDAQGFKM